MKASKVILIIIGVMVLLSLAGMGISILQKGGKYDGRSMEKILGVQPEKATLDDIKKLSKAEVFQLFYSAPAPSFNEMKGEYRGVILKVGIMAPFIEFFMHNLFGPAHWEGKAFYPFERNKGYGYNLFKDSRWIYRTRKIDTEIGPSDYDGKPSFKINYSAYNSGVVNFQRDDLRKINDRLFIGLGHNAFIGGSINPGPFVIIGPAENWVGLDKQ